MNRCKAYTIQPKKCKMNPVKDKNYCRHHSNYDQFFVSRPKKSIGVQTDDIINKGVKVSFSLFLFYFSVYVFVIFYFIKFKVSIDENF
jgi:hypothetical protein